MLKGLCEDIVTCIECKINNADVCLTHLIGVSFGRRTRGAGGEAGCFFVLVKTKESHTVYAVWLWGLSDIVVFECLRALGHLSPSQRI